MHNLALRGGNDHKLSAFDLQILAYMFEGNILLNLPYFLISNMIYRSTVRKTMNYGLLLNKVFKFIGIDMFGAVGTVVYDNIGPHII